MMVYLTVHLVREIRLCRPISTSWMYGMKRHKKVMKGYVRNHRQLKGCIVESYIVEKVNEFCIEYMVDYEAIRPPKKTLVGSLKVKDSSMAEVKGVDLKDLQLAHVYILHNTTCVDPYADQLSILLM